MSDLSIPTYGSADSGSVSPIDFEPLAGSVIVLAYDNVGEVGGVSIEARELRNDRGGVSRGALAGVKQDEYRSNNSFIKAEELPELLKAFSALLAVNSNPTKFSNFEVKYKTHEDFEIIAFNSRNGISYVVRSGTAQVFLQRQHLLRIVEMLNVVWKKIESLQ
ncbi:hypothetical protein [Terriglobus sp. RCC_193]|uniref:hypothetical protein n=1 Tax=Terriglobus sp. RCC_193 TaxID=3239218 RepID=UPI0035264878